MTVTMPETETTITSVVTEETTPALGDSNSDATKKRHMINPPMNTHIWKPGMETQDIVDIARVRGLEIVALCGYRWVPTRDPAGLETCDPCVDAASRIVSEG